MDAQLFYGHSPPYVWFVGSLVLTAAAALGYAVGCFARSRVSDRSQIGTIQASMLGLLALLLGFTFAVASSRYDARRDLAVDEANSLGTTFLRAQMLPEPYRTSLSQMLRRYVDLRLESALVVEDYSKQLRLRQKTEALQQKIWHEAAKAVRDNHTPITALFVSSLNESIDLYSSRVAAYLARVPDTILWMLAGIALAALGIVGYGFGLAGQRSWLVMGLVAALIAAAIVMIVDLDRPESGPTRTNHQSIADLRDSLSGYEVK